MGRSYVWYYSQSNATFGIDNWCRTSNSSWCKICIFSHPVNHIVFLLLIGGRKFWDHLWHERICAGPFDGASDHVLHSGQRVDVLATQHHGVEGQDGPGDVHDDWDEERLLEDEVDLTNFQKLTFLHQVRGYWGSSSWCSSGRRLHVWLWQLVSLYDEQEHLGGLDSFPSCRYWRTSLGYRHSVSSGSWGLRKNLKKNCQHCVQEGGAVEIIFDLIAFELDPNRTHQAGFFTPDFAHMWMNPGDSTWKNRSGLALTPGSGLRSSDWQMRWFTSEFSTSLFKS